MAIVQGAREAVEAVVDNADYVQFTGSSATGAKVMERAARRLTPISLELGGKDPMIVLEDADVDLAAHAAVWGAMFNAGQTCVSVERVYVLEPVYDQFVAAVVRDVKNLKMGAGDGHDFGALIDDSQVAVDRAPRRRRAGQGRQGADRRQARATGPGSFYPPTVLVDVDHSMACMTEETFGPTLPIMKVSTVAEAVRLANDSPYGLSAVGVLQRYRACERRCRGTRLRCGQHQRRDLQPDVHHRADGRLEDLGHRRPLRRRRRPAQVLPPGGGGRAAHQRRRGRQLLQQLAEGAQADEHDDDQVGADPAQAHREVAAPRHLPFTFAVTLAYARVDTFCR